MKREFRGWTLEDIYARYARPVLAEAEHRSELADRLVAETGRIERQLASRGLRRRTTRAYAFLAGYANGGLRTMFHAGPEPETCGHSAALLRLTAACRVAIGWRVLAA